MKQAYYFSHDYNARGDRKLVNLFMRYGMEGIGSFWCLVEMLYEEGGYLPLEYDRFAFELRTNIKIVKSIINDFDLFVNDGSKFCSMSVLARLRKRYDKSEKARESVQKRWSKVEKDTIVLPTYSGRNSRKEKKKNDNKEKESIPFKIFWDSYDKKVGWEKCEIIWRELTNTERNACMAKISAYKLSTPDKKFRMNPEKYLNQKGWLNEIIIQNVENGSINRRENKKINDLWN
jgi:hypothetical protein